MIRRAALLTMAILTVAALAAGANEVYPVPFSDDTVFFQGVEASADTVLVEFEDDALEDAAVPLNEVPMVRTVRLSTTAGTREFAGLREPVRLRSDLSHAVVTFDRSMGLDEAIRRIGGIDGVKAVYPNNVVHLMFTPNDPIFPKQTNFRQIYTEQVWDLTRGAGAIVAVVDTGYRTSGLDDRVVNLDTGYDFWGNDADTNDFIGHGTHVANTIAQATNNGVGAAGIAHEATVLVLKVFPDSDDGAYEGDVLDAINYAVDNGAHVINMSLGGTGSNNLSRSTMNNALAAGSVPVAASGNEGLSSVSYPAAYDAVVAVGSVNLHNPGAQGSRSNFSNYGSALDIVAPGEGIIQETYVSGFGTGHVGYWGTSSAAPHVSAVIALMVSSVGVSDPDGITEALYETAQDIGAAGFDTQTGWGEVNAMEAVFAYSGTVNQPPVAQFEGELTAPLTVYLSAAESYDPDGAVVEYRWDFGDGSTGTGEDGAYRYDEPGKYRIELTVTDDKGDTDTASRTVTLNGDGPSGGGGDDDDDDSGSSSDCSLTGSGGSGLVALFLIALMAATPFALRRLAKKRVRH